MIFRPELAKKVLRGEKTVTRRRLVHRDGRPKDSRTYEMACPICRQASELSARTGSDYAVMKDHPTCQRCGVLIGSEHVTKHGPICSSCVGMPGPNVKVAGSLKMAEMARLSARRRLVKRF